MLETSQRHLGDNWIRTLEMIGSLRNWRKYVAQTVAFSNWLGNNLTSFVRTPAKRRRNFENFCSLPDLFSKTKRVNCYKSIEDKDLCANKIKETYTAYFRVFLNCIISLTFNTTSFFSNEFLKCFDNAEQNNPNVRLDQLKVKSIYAQCLVVWYE